MKKNGIEVSERIWDKILDKVFAQVKFVGKNPKKEMELPNSPLDGDGWIAWHGEIEDWVDEVLQRRESSPRIFLQKIIDRILNQENSQSMERIRAQLQDDIDYAYSRYYFKKYDKFY